MVPSVCRCCAEGVSWGYTANVSQQRKFYTRNARLTVALLHRAACGSLNVLTNFEISLVFALICAQQSTFQRFNVANIAG